MIARNRTMAALFAGLTAGVLTLVLPVEAQVPSTAPVVKPTDTVNLTMEQRHVVKEIILKDMKVSALQDQATKMPTQVGETVPSGIPLQPMPVEVAAKIPQLKAHSFLVKDDKVIIIDPKDNKVAALIE